MAMCRKVVRLRGGVVSLAKTKDGFRSQMWPLRRFTLLDPGMYRSGIVCSRGRGLGTRLVFFGGVMLMATAATIETVRVLCGARGYRG
jgi:hypothetical protein